MKYLLEVDVDSQVVKVWTSIVVKPHEQWQTTVVLQITGQTSPVKVEALLYHEDNTTTTTVYRHVLLWLRT